MIKKYNKITLATAAAFCILMGISASEAAVTLTFAQSGLNVTATWSGTYLTPVTAPFITVYFGTTSSYGINTSSVAEALGAVGNGSLYDNAGTLESGVITKVSIFGLYTGDTFGFASSGKWLMLPPSTPASTPISPSGVMTFENQTLAAMDVANFNNTLVFTGTGSVGGSREIRFTTAAVPEPASAMLGGIGALAMMLRRRRV